MKPPRWSVVATVTVFSILLRSGEAHISIICSSTSHQDPGVLRFWFGTYHPFTDNVEGQGHIRSPDGAVLSADFGEKCKAGSIQQSLPTATTDDYAASLKSGCTSLGAAQDSDVVCYDKYPENARVPDNTARAITGHSPVHNCYDKHKNGFQTWYLVKLKNAVSGTYEMWTSNVNEVLKPGASASYPCSMEEGTRWFFDVSVIEGPQTCGIGPPASLTQNVVPASLEACVGAARPIYEGTVCHAQCEIGYSKHGLLVCDVRDDGSVQWGDFLCTNSPVCELPSVQNSDVDPNIQGIKKPCSTVTVAGTECQYTCSKPPGFVSHGNIRCDRTGRWVAATGYHACAEPTPSPPTSAPLSPSPPSLAPDTQAPQTPAPASPAPPTSSPPTSAPPTAAPPTSSPPTSAPPTAAPPTSSPPTLSPPTPAPLSLAPRTSSPLTMQPVTHTQVPGIYKRRGDYSWWFWVAIGFGQAASAVAILLLHKVRLHRWARKALLEEEQKGSPYGERNEENPDEEKYSDTGSRD